MIMIWNVHFKTGSLLTSLIWHVEIILNGTEMSKNAEVMYL